LGREGTEERNLRIRERVKGEVRRKNHPVPIQLLDGVSENLGKRKG